MRGVLRAVGSCIVFASVATAHAVAQAQGTPAAVDPADLPPLPAGDEELSSSATVLAASSAEEDVVVGAAKREQSLGNVASAVTVISGDRIRRFGYRTVGEAVASVAGVYLEDNRINASLGMRGLQIPGDFNTRILILVDGATSNEAWGASSGLGYETLVSIDDIARIEVIRGPVSSVYGANAFFGIINIVTRSAAESSRAWGRVTAGSIGGLVANAGFAAGDVNHQVRGTVLALRRVGETLSVPGIGDNLSGDGGYGMQAALVATYGRTFAQVRAYRVRQDSPFAPYDGDPAAPRPYLQRNTQLLVEGGHTREINDRITLAVRGYLNMYQFYDDIKELGEPEPFLDFGDSTTVGAEVRGRFEVLPDGKLGVTAGTEANYNKTKSRAFYRNNEADGASVPLNFRLTGIYTEADTAPTDWFGATVGLRFDDNSEVDQRLSPRAALFLSKREKYGLKLLYAEGFRNPSAFEGAFYDKTTFIDNRDIGSERIRSFEAVAWAKPLPGLSTRLSGFYWNARDVVMQQVYEPDPSLLQFQNVGQFKSIGVEAEASYRTASGWYAFGGGSLQRVGGREEAGAAFEYGHVIDSAPYTAAGGLSTPRLGGYAHLSTELQLIGPRTTRAALDGSPSPESPAWVNWNIIAYAPNIRGIDVSLAVRNLIGTRDLLPAPQDYDRSKPDAVVIPRIPGEGREVYLRVGYSY